NAPLAGAAADAKVDEVTRGIKAILDLMRRKAPEATLLLTGITPRNDVGSQTATMSTINRINANLSNLADARKVRYLNINDKLADRDGNLVDGAPVDGVALS